MTAEYFVTGTDTGVGKTTVAAGLLGAYRRRGLVACALKPAETGGTEDADLLIAACGGDLSLDDVAPQRYMTPVAPAVAARREGRPFDMARVEAACARLRARRPDLLLVEGAGGLLAPYSDELVGADVASRLGLPLLVVARASLGTINHTLLTVFEARRRGLAVAGVILNRVQLERGPDEDDNAAEISRLGMVRILGTVAHLPAAARRDVHALAETVAAAVDCSALDPDAHP